MLDKEHNSLIYDLMGGLVDDSRQERFRTRLLKACSAECACLYHFMNDRTTEMVFNSKCNAPARRKLESLVRGLKTGAAKSLPANKVLNNRDMMSLPDNHQNGFLRKLAECFWDHHRPKYYLFCTVASNHGAALLVLSRTIRNQRDFCAHEKKVAAMLCPHLENHLRLRYLCAFWRKLEWMNWFLEHHQLSKREKEIAHLILEGIELGKISDRLEISEDTIRDHLKRVYRKLRIHSRTELFASYTRTCRTFINESLGE